MEWSPLQSVVLRTFSSVFFCYSLLKELFIYLLLWHIELDRTPKHKSHIHISTYLGIHGTQFLVACLIPVLISILFIQNNIYNQCFHKWNDLNLDAITAAGFATFAIYTLCALEKSKLHRNKPEILHIKMIIGVIQMDIRWLRQQTNW